MAFPALFALRAQFDPHLIRERIFHRLPQPIPAQALPQFNRIGNLRWRAAQRTPQLKSEHTLKPLVFSHATGSDATGGVAQLKVTMSERLQKGDQGSPVFSRQV